MSRSTVWHIGSLLNLIQSTFVGILRVLSVPIVLSLSVASGYTTFYGLSFFITPWIALIVTIAVQSILVICSLELAGMHWRANPARYLTVVLSLLVAITVSITFSYFKFYEFSQRDSLLIDRQARLSGDVSAYLAEIVALKSQLTAEQQEKIAIASRDTQQAYMSTHPGMAGQKAGKGKIWAFYNEVLQGEQAKLTKLDTQTARLEKSLAETRKALRVFTARMNDEPSHGQLIENLHVLEGEADLLASGYGKSPIHAPLLPSFAEFARGITPSFDMWKNISWFAFACAAMVDFFTLVLSYRLEMAAPGPLSSEEMDLAFQGLRQFSQFTINRNDELEFVIDRTELERARRVPDWQRMFTVAFLLNRGYLRKMSARSVEFAPNLYPIVAERLTRQQTVNPKADKAHEDPLATAMREKFRG